MEVINKKTITELYKSQLTTSILFVIVMFIIVGLASDRIVEIIHALIKMSQAEKMMVDEPEAYALTALYFVVYCCLIVMLIFLSVRLVKILKDYEDMEKRNYVVFVGKVIKLKLYEHNRRIRLRYALRRGRRLSLLCLGGGDHTFRHSSHHNLHKPYHQ